MFNKKIVGLLVVSLMFLSMFAILVSAQGTAPSSGQSILDKIVALFSTSTEPSFFDGIVKSTESDFFKKAVLMFLVVMVIYSISSILPFVGENKWVAFFISLAIGYLSVAYLLRGEIEAVLLSYGALGITLTLIIPFIIIAVISKRAYSTGKLFLSKLLWVVFLIIVVLRWFAVEGISDFAAILFPLIAVATVVMIIIEKKLWRLVSRGQNRQGLNVLQNDERLGLTSQVDSYRQEIQTLMRQGYDANHNTIKDLERKIKFAEKKIAQLS